MFKVNDAMSAQHFRFRLGDFDCLVVNDGTYTYPSPAQNVFINFFVNAPPAHLRQVLRRHNLDPETWTEYVSPYPCLVIDTGRHHVLVDTGAGSFAPTTGQLVPGLHAAGIQPTDIDRVIVTHAHPDHLGGNLDRDGNPAFPNATYVIGRDEWTFWTSEPNLGDLPISDHGKEILVKVAHANLQPLRDQIELIGHDGEIVPGIRGIAAPGHTPGHMAVEVTSGRDQLLHIADTVLHPIHLEEPNWYSAVAIHPHQVADTRRRLFEAASKENTLTLASHFPFPGVGHVVQRGEEWRWQPI